MEFLERNIDWLDSRLEKFQEHYLIFDCPGQVELYTHHRSIRHIVTHLQKRKDVRFCAVHLVDSHYCSDASKYISVLLVSLSTMLHLELPHINILSKIDLMKRFGKLAFSLDYYTEVQDLSYLLEHLDSDPFSQRFSSLNRALCELVEDYGLISFQTLNISNKNSALKVLKEIDKVLGYVQSSSELEAMMGISALPDSGALSDADDDESASPSDEPEADD
mmetsp:Transcript_17881/g.29378  ORF Transcript_17881/g.29378 Transcript_17881/m.29378 type:complete len:220 (-) Transcript_17881:16-675(-)